MAQLKPARAERTVDNALARRLVTIPALWGVLNDVAATTVEPGPTVLRRVLAERGARHVAPESELEHRFVELARQYGLPQPDRQVDIGNAELWIGRVDFAVPGGKSDH